MGVRRPKGVKAVKTVGQQEVVTPPPHLQVQVSLCPLPSCLSIYNIHTFVYACVFIITGEDTQTQQCGNQSHIPSYAIVGDNVDKTINPRFMTFEHQRQSLHYFHSYAVLDRVNCADLPSGAPAGDIKSLSFAAFLPTPEDCSVIRYNYSVLLGRVLVEKLSFFKKFQDCIPKHLVHQHSEEMKKKSEVVSTYSIYF